MKELIQEIGRKGGPVDLWETTTSNGKPVAYVTTGSMELYNVNEEEAQGAIAELLRLDMHERGVGHIHLLSRIEGIEIVLFVSDNSQSTSLCKNVLSAYAEAWLIAFDKCGWGLDIERGRSVRYGYGHPQDIRRGSPSKNW